MKQMFKAVRRIVEEFEDVQVVYPVHLNPAVREAAEAHFADSDRVHLLTALNICFIGLPKFSRLCAVKRIILLPSSLSKIG